MLIKTICVQFPAAVIVSMKCIIATEPAGIINYIPQGSNTAGGGGARYIAGGSGEQHWWVVWAIWDYT